VFLFVRSERHGEWLSFFVVSYCFIVLPLRSGKSSFLKGLSSSLRRLSLSLSLAAAAAAAAAVAVAVAALSLNEFDDDDDEDSFTRAQINTRIVLLTFSLSNTIK
jgi:hypothetical protein